MTFDTTTPKLLALSAWLAEHGCTHVAMAIRPSFVPEAPTQGMRALLRTRKRLVRDPDTLFALVQRRVKAPQEKLRAALTERVTDLRQFDALAAAIAGIDAAVDRDLAPFRQALRLLRTIPGVSDSTRLRNPLVQWAWAGRRKKASSLQAQSQRLRHRRGPKKAIYAVAASILTAAYPMLRTAPSAKISAPTTSAAPRKRPRPTVSPARSPGSASPAPSNPRRISSRFLFSLFSGPTWAPLGMHHGTVDTRGQSSLC